MAPPQIDLSEVSVDALLAEVQRRLECQTKPEKRVILIGAAVPGLKPPYYRSFRVTGQWLTNLLPRSNSDGLGSVPTKGGGVCALQGRRDAGRARSRRC